MGSVAQGEEGGLVVGEGGSLEDPGGGDDSGSRWRGGRVRF